MLPINYAKTIAFLLFTLLLMLVGGAISYFLWVPGLQHKLAVLETSQQQRDADKKAIYDEQQKEKQYVAQQINDWYTGIISHIHRDPVGMYLPAASSVQGPTSTGSPQGVDGTIGQLGPDLDSIGYEGKSIPDRLVECKKDAAKVTAFQEFVNRNNLPIQ